MSFVRKGWYFYDVIFIFDNVANRMLMLSISIAKRDLALEAPPAMKDRVIYVWDESWHEAVCKVQ